MLILSMMCLMSVSCRSVSCVECLKSNVESQEVHDSQLSTFDIQYSSLRDSIVYREKVVHDTVYITKEVYRDRLEARGERQKAVRTDTVVVTEWREKVIELPPEKYVPKFYKWCTGLLWAIGLLAIGYWLLKWWLKRIYWNCWRRKCRFPAFLGLNIVRYFLSRTKCWDD